MIQLPPGTSCGPWSTWPPWPVTRSAAASMASTVKYRSQNGAGTDSGLGHHAADRLRAGRKQLVGPHRTHVDRLRLRPAEQVRIEGKGGLPLARVQLVPAGRPGVLGAGRSGGCSLAPLNRTKLAPCGSATTANRPTPGMSSADLWMAPPACLTRPAAASTSSTPT